MVLFELVSDLGMQMCVGVAVWTRAKKKSRAKKLLQVAKTLFSLFLGPKVPLHDLKERERVTSSWKIAPGTFDSHSKASQGKGGLGFIIGQILWKAKLLQCIKCPDQTRA